MSDEDKKSAFLDDQKFSVEEGAAYRVFRTGAIWMNKLFFASLALLAIWLFLGLTGAVEPGCAPSFTPGFNGTNETGDPIHTDEEGVHCSVWLSTTAKYLGGMAGVSFALSILFGFLGLVVGKRILEMTPREDEVASRRMDGTEESEADEDE